MRDRLISVLVRTGQNMVFYNCVEVAGKSFDRQIDLYLIFDKNFIRDWKLETE